MTRRHNNGGFTLVELMVTIAIGSLITLAGTTTLLLGLRINADSTRTIQQQNTSSMLMEIVENVAEAGVIAVSDDHRSIQIVTKDEATNTTTATTYISYVGSAVCLKDNTPFMEEVSFFDATLTNSNQLTVTIKVGKDNTEYTATVYCRMNPVTTPEPADPAGG